MRHPNRRQIRVEVIDRAHTARTFGADLEGRAGVWQPRYREHRIRDDDDYVRHRDYIHLNPVKHGYVDRPGDWPWSSFHRHGASGWLDPNWPGTSPVALPDVAGE